MEGYICDAQNYSASKHFTQLRWDNTIYSKKVNWEGIDFYTDFVIIDIRRLRAIYRL